MSKSKAVNFSIYQQAVEMLVSNLCETPQFSHRKDEIRDVVLNEGAAAFVRHEFKEKYKFGSVVPDEQIKKLNRDDFKKMEMESIGRIQLVVERRLGLRPGCLSQQFEYFLFNCGVTFDGKKEHLYSIYEEVNKGLNSEDNLNWYKNYHIRSLGKSEYELLFKSIVNTIYQESKNVADDYGNFYVSLPLDVLTPFFKKLDPENFQKSTSHPGISGGR